MAAGYINSATGVSTTNITIIISNDITTVTVAKVELKPLVDLLGLIILDYQALLVVVHIVVVKAMVVVVVVILEEEEGDK